VPNSELNPAALRSSSTGNTIVPVITAAAAVTGLADNPAALWQALMKSASAIGPVSRFAVERYGAKSAAMIPDLEARGSRSLLPALLDRLLSSTGPVAPDTFLITATTKCGIDALEKYRKGQPADISDVLPAQMTAAIQRRFNLGAAGFNISAACASSTIAAARAAAMIAGGRAEAVLVCCADIVTEFVFSGFSALKALSADPCRPFDRHRDGLSLGEGAAALVLMSPERAKRQGLEPLGKVVGWGVANDASHITAPDRNGCGLIEAVGRALTMAGMGPNDIAAVSAHGTGTIYNDLMEISAFRKIFGGKPLPVYSIKGAIGHTLAAAGAIEVVVGLQALQAGIAPPTIGLVEPMEEAVGFVENEPAPFAGSCLLTTNSGFGGINAALVLGK